MQLLLPKKSFTLPENHEHMTYSQVVKFDMPIMPRSVLVLVPCHLKAEAGLKSIGILVKIRREVGIKRENSI